MNLTKAYENWKSRHLNAVSFWLHMAGIPACFVAAPIMLILQQWWWALGLFVGGYIVQFVGHWIEGNQSGEEMLVRRLFPKLFSREKGD
jgi:hypothetical protein